VAPFIRWLEDYERRLAMHDGGVELLARELASRTDWTVLAGAPGFSPPAAGDGAATPDILCRRGSDAPPVAVEVELTETLVRRETVRRLREYVDSAVDIRVAVIADADDHEATIDDARRMLRFVGLEIPVAAVAPDRERVTGVTW